ncbi:zinc ribbon domain-containing protein [bacterium]|nr:MAG: zinc ribbon domain-containing protein [bacterium]
MIPPAPASPALTARRGGACPACGLELPGHARFCARCGAPQPASRRDVEAWVLAVFGLGIALSATIAVLYGAIAVDPAGASAGLDPALIRTASVGLAATLGALCLLQAVATAGLVRGREWGRVTATIVCVAWSVTCVGLPVAILVLRSIWRRRPAGAPLTAPVALF